MKTGEAAKIMGVDRSTLLDWINIRGLTRFFSASAAGNDGNMQRVLTESDLLVLNTIRACRSKNMNWDDIEIVLDNGERERSFPQNAISGDPRTIPLVQAEVSAKALGTMVERDAAFARVEELTEEVRNLSVKLSESEKARYEDREKLLREIGELRHQLGRLEGQLEMYREGRAKLNNE